MRVVLDTNVLLAAFATRGLCDALLETCLESHAIVLSEHIVSELRRHLVGKLKIPAEQADAIATFLRQHSTMVEPGEVAAGTCRDPGDLPVLGTVLAGEADCLVTGDRELQRLRRFRGARILSPRQFHDRLR